MKMARSLITSLLMLNMVFGWTLATDEGLFTCANDGGLKISSIKMSSFTPNRIQALGHSTTCASGLTATNTHTVIAGSGTNADPYTADINNNKCGVTSSGTVYTYKFIVAKHANIIRGDDVIFTFTCDSSAPNDVVKTATISSVTGDPTAGTVTKDVPVEMSVVTAVSTGSNIASTTLGTICHLKMTLTHQGNAVKKCKITTCEAASDSAFTSPISLYDTSGCSVSSSGIYAVTTGKFTETRAASTAAYLSATFKMFRFKDTATIYFRCKCHGCLSTTDTACDAPACTSKRRRRDVSALRNNTLASTVLLVLEGSKVAKSPVGTLQQEVNFTNCLTHVSFIWVVVILALLLVISLAISVFFCSQLIRQRNQTKGW